MSGIVYDAKSVCDALGFTCECSDPAPQADDGKMVVWYGGWSLSELLETGMVKTLLVNFKESYCWRAPSGYYHACIPLLGTNHMTYQEQVGTVRPESGFSVLPTTVGVTALLVHLRLTGSSLLGTKRCHCAEDLSPGGHSEIRLWKNTVIVDAGDDVEPNYNLFLGVARKS